jgi:hypothetical protein
LPTARSRFVYYPPMAHLVADVCPSGARGWTMSVNLDHPAGAAANDADGALIARGSLNSGFLLAVIDGRLVFDYNYFHDHTRVVSAAPLAPGAHEVSAVVTRNAEGGAEVELRVDGQVVGTGAIPRLLFIVSSTGMDIGRSLSPISHDYQTPFAYPGRIARVEFEIPESRPRGEVRAQVRAEMTRQ